MGEGGRTCQWVNSARGMPDVRTLLLAAGGRGPQERCYQRHPRWMSDYSLRKSPAKEAEALECLQKEGHTKMDPRSQSCEPTLSRSQFILASFALQGSSASMSPVQVQKFFFLLDKEIPTMTSGPHFNFRPYDYGPFDKNVYLEIEDLERKGDTQITTESGIRSYKLTQEGKRKGDILASHLSPKAKEYISRVGEFVRRLSFEQLVSSIYKAYPEMREKSVFRQ